MAYGGAPRKEDNFGYRQQALATNTDLEREYG